MSLSYEDSQTVELAGMYALELRTQFWLEYGGLMTGGGAYIDVFSDLGEHLEVRWVTDRADPRTATATVTFNGLPMLEPEVPDQLSEGEIRVRSLFLATVPELFYKAGPVGIRALANVEEQLQILEFDGGAEYPEGEKVL